MLVQIAIGDAYGAGFEYARNLDLNTLERYVQHPRHSTVKPGCYTDDTQMALALGEVLADRRPWTPAVIAHSFVHCFHRDPRDGYARGFQKFLEATKTAEEFLRNIRPDSEKSGAAMRASVIGLDPDEANVLHQAEVQAKLTHDTANGISAAQAAALMAHFFKYAKGTRHQLVPYLDEKLPGRPWGGHSGAIGSLGIDSVRAAVAAVALHDNLADLLKQVVSFGGDTDTAAAIALGAASQAGDIQQNLPRRLYDGLEDGPYGKSYLEVLDRRLAVVYP